MKVLSVSVDSGVVLRGEFVRVQLRPCRSSRFPLVFELGLKSLAVTDPLGVSRRVLFLIPNVPDSEQTPGSGPGR